MGKYDVFFYAFGYEKGMKIDFQSDYLNKLKKWGFKTSKLLDFSIMSPN